MFCVYACTRIHKEADKWSGLIYLASDSTGLALFDLRNEMSLVDSFPTTEENESIENLRVVYDVQNGRSGH